MKLKLITFLVLLCSVNAFAHPYGSYRCTKNGQTLNCQIHALDQLFEVLGIIS